MEAPVCTKCQGTGYLFRRFYTAVRACSCPLGEARTAEATVQANTTDADRAAEWEAACARRRARRASAK